MKKISVFSILVILTFASILPFAASSNAKAETATVPASQIAANISPSSLLSASVAYCVAVGSHPGGLAYDASNGYIYVANSASANVSVLSPTDHVVNTVSFGDSPSNIAYDSYNTNIYVTDSAANKVYVLNSTNQVLTNVNVGITPMGIASNPNNGNIYVANSASDNVSVISPSNNLTHTIAVGTNPVAIAFSDANCYIYVANAGSDSISVISPGDLVIATLKLGCSPDAVAYDSVSGNIYVASNLSSKVLVFSPENQLISTISTASGATSMAYDSGSGSIYVGTDNISIISPTDQLIGALNSGIAPGGMAYDPENGKIYASIASTNKIMVIFTTDTVTSCVKVGAHPASLAYDMLNNNLYIANLLSDSVSILSTLNNTIVNESAGCHPNMIVYDPGNNNLYVDTSGIILKITQGHNITSISTTSGLPSGGLTYDPATCTLYIFANNFTSGGIFPGVFPFLLSNCTFKQCVSLSGIPFSVAYDSGSHDLYAALQAYCSVKVLSPANKIIANISVPGEPDAITYNPGNGNMYVASCLSNIVCVISPSNHVIATLKVGTHPDAIAYDPANGNIYVANSQSDNVSVISPNNRVVNSVPVGIHPDALTFDPQNGNMYVANSGSDTVCAIDTLQNLTLFTETGLPAGASWNVTIGPATYTSNSSTIALSLPSGIIPYKVSSTKSDYAPATGTGVISTSGPFTQENVVFSPVNYAVQFNETGLPSGSAWTVTINGSSSTTTSSSITFHLMNGTYDYSISSSDKAYSPAVRSSVVEVNGSAVFATEYFSSVTYNITAHETGLASGTAWSITVGKVQQSTSNTTMTFAMPNGTYAYTPGAVNGYHSSSSGLISVNGSSENITVTYTRDTYTLNVLETGLIAGTTWTFSINQNSYNLNGSSLSIQLTDGTYTTNATGPSGYSVNIPSSITIDNSNASLSVGFSNANNHPSNHTISSTSQYEYLGAGIAIGAVVAAVAVMLSKGTGFFKGRKGKGRQ